MRFGTRGRIGIRRRSFYQRSLLEHTREGGQFICYKTDPVDLLTRLASTRLNAQKTSFRFNAQHRWVSWRIRGEGRVTMMFYRICSDASLSRADARWV